MCGKNFQVRGETQLKHLRTFLRILSKSLFWQSFDVLSLNYRSKVIFRYFYFCFAGYDTEYTETDRKDIQNLAQEIETKYTQYGKHLVILCLALLLTILELRKDVEYEADDTLPTCCLAMCLDWCLDKICCREVEEDMVYMPAVRSSIWRSGENIQSAVKTVSLSIHFQFVFRSIDLLYNKLLNVSIDRNCIEINGAYLSLYQVSSVQDCIKLHQNQKIDTTLASILRPP